MHHSTFMPLPILVPLPPPTAPLPQPPIPTSPSPTMGSSQSPSQSSNKNSSAEDLPPVEDSESVNETPSLSLHPITPSGLLSTTLTLFDEWERPEWDVRELLMKFPGFVREGLLDAPAHVKVQDQRSESQTPAAAASPAGGEEDDSEDEEEVSSRSVLPLAFLSPSLTHSFPLPENAPGSPRSLSVRHQTTP